MIARLRQLLSRKFIQDTLTLQAGKFGLLALSLISSVTVWRLLGPKSSGDFALAGSLLVIWQSLDFTGVGKSTSVRLAIAIGARDEAAILDLMAFYIKVNVAVNLGVALVILLLGAPVALLLYNGGARIAALAFWLGVGAVADGLYGLVIIALQSRRSMRSLALMQNANQLVLTVCAIAAVLISPTPESLVTGRVIYSYSTLLLALLVYSRVRTQGQVGYPALSAIFRRARTVSPRPYWRFGVANAIDKNIAELFVQLPIQLVGIFAGARAVGYLNLAMSGITQASVFSSAVLDNMQVVVPQAVGRRDYAGLWRNFRRVLVVMTLVSLTLYGALVLVAPLLIPPVLGARWIPAIPPLIVLAIFGAVTTVGGNFGPLYRAFGLMRRAIVVKLLSLALVLPVSLFVFQRLSSQSLSNAYLGRYFAFSALTPANLVGSEAGALIGAWMVDAIFVLSIALTAIVTLPELRKRAAQSQNAPAD